MRCNRIVAAAAFLAPFAFAVAASAEPGNTPASQSGSLAIENRSEAVEMDNSLPKGFMNGTVAESQAESVARYFAKRAARSPVADRPATPVPLHMAG
jgi:hypothetical protein